MAVNSEHSFNSLLQTMKASESVAHGCKLELKDDSLELVTNRLLMFLDTLTIIQAHEYNCQILNQSNKETNKNEQVPHFHIYGEESNHTQVGIQ